jgi:hypothetical protein
MELHLLCSFCSRFDTQNLQPMDLVTAVLLKNLRLTFNLIFKVLLYSHVVINLSNAGCFQCGAGVAHTILLAADDDDESKEILKKLEVNDD